MPCGFQTDEWALSHQQISLLSSSEVTNSLPATAPLLCHLPGSVHTVVQMGVSAIVPSSMTTLQSLMFYHILEGHREESPEHDLLQTDFPLLQYLNILCFSTYRFGGTWTWFMRWDTLTFATSRCTSISTSSQKKAMIQLLIFICVSDCEKPQTHGVNYRTFSKLQEVCSFLPPLPSTPGLPF